MQKFTCQLCHKVIKKENLAMQKIIKKENFIVCKECYNKQDKMVSFWLKGIAIAVLIGCVYLIYKLFL